MAKKKSQVDKFFDGKMTVSAATGWVRDIADSARGMGHDKLADDLESIAYSLEHGSKEMVEAYQEEISGSLQRAQQETGLVLSALLGSIQD